MLQKFKITILGLVIVAGLASGPLSLAAEESGATKALGGLDSTAQTGGVKASETDLPTIIGRVVGAILAFVGAIFFLIIVYAGIMWMVAKGNEEEIKKAKEMLFGAFLGLIVVLGAYAITRLAGVIFSEALGK